ncbi:MAG: hypothetical protein NZ921_02300 [Candidatus Caldarchaeum sp.]|nr:hypothetical protein [Candidatus Caldarchaeum sp.]
MGEVRTFFTIHGPKGRVTLEGLADTRATFTKAPVWVANQLGIELGFVVEVEMADGRTVERKAGLAEVEIDDVRRPVLVTFSEGDELPLVGLTTLETLGFRVNPLTRKLEKVKAIEY